MMKNNLPEREMQFDIDFITVEDNEVEELIIPARHRITAVNKEQAEEKINEMGKLWQGFDIIEIRSVM